MPNIFQAIKSGAINKSFMAPVDNRGGWSPYIREPYAGAWQNGDGWTVDSVLAYPPVYSCITLISSDVSKLCPQIKREDKDGIWNEDKSLSQLKILRKPNNFQNRIQFIESWIISKAIRGNTYVLKERNNRGDIVKLHILEPSRVTVLVSSDGAVWYQLGNDNLVGIPSGSVTVPASEIIHDRINPLFHPLVGVSPLFSCGESATGGLKIIQDSSKFFSNGANPSGILTAPGSIGDDTAARLKTTWATNFTGANSGKVAILGDGLKFEPMRMTAVDAQLIDQMKWSAESVCSAFHVPAYKVGIGALPTNGNIEALTQDYYSQCLQRFIEDFEICMDEGLEIPEGYRIELDLDGLFRMDSKTLMETLAAGVKGSILVPNEARKRVNLKPVKGGNAIYMQQQNYSLEALANRDATNPLAVVAPVAQPQAQPVPANNINDDSSKKAVALFKKRLLKIEY